jgi:hypothetical protein
MCVGDVLELLWNRKWVHMTYNNNSLITIIYLQQSTYEPKTDQKCGHGFFILSGYDYSRSEKV